MFKLTSAIFAITFFFAASAVSAYVASSTNYRLESDSINVGGEETSTSTNYNLHDTIGEVGTGELSGTTYKVYAGYRQMVAGEAASLSLTAPASISLTPAINRANGGEASGNATWTVTTTSVGYTLKIKSSTNPALKSGSNSFSNYTTSAAGTADYEWHLGGETAEFGFSPYNSVSQTSRYKNNGALCGSGGNASDGFCWYGLSLSDETIANRSSATAAGGENTKINFKAAATAGGVETGSYTATIIITAVSN